MARQRKQEMIRRDDFEKLFIRSSASNNYVTASWVNFYGLAMGIDVLPVVSEGDELVSLADVLQTRDKCFTEDELWALCLETCKALQGLHSSSEAFQLLFVTPDSVAFDCTGRVCFLENVPDEPEFLYVAPEYDAVGHSFKSHLYSLGVSMWFAAEYGTAASSKNAVSEDLNSMIADMTKDRYEERPELTKVAKKCKQTMRGKDSREICRMHAILAGRMSRASSSVGKVLPLQNFDGKSAAGSVNLPNINKNDRNEAVIKGVETEIPETIDGDQNINENVLSNSTKEFLVTLEDIMCATFSSSTCFSIQFEEIVSICKESVLSLMRETSKKKSFTINNINSRGILFDSDGIINLAQVSKSNKEVTVQQLTVELCQVILPLLQHLKDNYKIDDENKDLNKIFKAFLSPVSDETPVKQHDQKLTDLLRVCNELVYKRGFNSSFSCQQLFKKYCDIISKERLTSFLNEKVTKTEETASNFDEDRFSPSQKILQSSFSSTSSTKSFLQNEISNKTPPLLINQHNEGAFSNEALTLLSGSDSAFKPISKVPNIKTNVASASNDMSPENVMNDSNSLSYPSAYNSSATHFKPIIIKPDKVVPKSIQEKNSGNHPNIKDEKINFNLLELKRNILKKQSTRSTWFDAVEKDAEENCSSEISVKKEILQQKIQSSNISQSLKFVGSKALRIEKTPPNMSNAAEMDPSSLTYRLEFDEASGEYLLKPIFIASHSKKLRLKRPGNKGESFTTVSEETMSNDAALKKTDDERQNTQKKAAACSPPQASNQLASPCLSKDSGIASVTQHQKLINDKVAEAAKITIMERFFNSQQDTKINNDDEKESIAEQKSVIDSASISELPQLPRILHCIRKEFGIGKLENGIEELSMTEYICSLRKLKPLTFNSAICEKFCQFDWSEKTLMKLHEIVNFDSGSDVDKGSERKLESFKHDQASKITHRKDECDSEYDFSLGEIKLEEKSPMHQMLPQTFCLDLLRGETEDPTSKNDIDKYHPCFNITSTKETNERSFKTKTIASSPSSKGSLKTRRGIPEFIQTEDRVKISPRLKEYRNDERPTSLKTFYDVPKLALKHSSTSVEISRPASRASSMFSHSGAISNRSSVLFSRPTSGLTQSSSSSLKNSSLSLNEVPSMIPPSARGSLKSFMLASKLNKKGRGSTIFLPADSEYFHSFMKQQKNEIGSLSCSVAIEASIGETQKHLVEEKQSVKTLQGQLLVLENSEISRLNIPKDTKYLQSRVKQQISSHYHRILNLQDIISGYFLLHIESSGLHHSLLTSFIDMTPSKPFHLIPQKENFQLDLRFDFNQCLDIVMAGTPRALISFLYSNGCLCNSFVHHFFFTYRYILSPIQLYNALLDYFMSSLSPLSGSEYLAVNVVNRSLDLLQIWIDCFFNIDFEDNPRLIDAVSKLVKDQMAPLSADSADQILRSIEEFRYGRKKMEIKLSHFLFLNDNLCINSPPFMKMDSLDTNGDKWALLVPPTTIADESRSRIQNVTSGLTSCLNSKKQVDNCEVYVGASLVNFEDGFTIGDYSVHTLSAALSLLQWECFIQTHPIDFLDTRSIGVVLSQSSTNKSVKSMPVQRSLQLILTEPTGTVTEDMLPSSLFVSPRNARSRKIVSLVRHSQMVSHWAASELLTSPSFKVQLAKLTKFISVAKHTLENGDLATCSAIAEALECLVVKQLPAWRSLPSRTVHYWELVATARKTFQETPFFSKEEKYKDTVLPPICHIVSHVQEIEAKGFIIVATPANANPCVDRKFSWTEFNVLAEIIDQIRVCRRTEFSPPTIEDELIDTLKHRIIRMAEEDIISLASKNQVNFALKTATEGKKIQSALKNVKEIFKAVGKD